MCGIAGYFRPGLPTGQSSTGGRFVDRQLIEKMCDVITHRGPDDAGYHVENGAAIGMRRLSIIDIASGHQPISNEDGSVWIVFNGEIYNFAELRNDLIARGHSFKTHSDTETIVHLYEEEGERCVERLRGMFGFAIWDGRENKLFLARDRAGKKPLHYTMVGDTLVFGSEIKSLLQFPGVERRANAEAISDYLSFGYVPDPQTAFSGIHKLPPGHTMTFRDGRTAIRRYWDFNFDAVDQPPREESFYAERLRELIAEAVKIRLVSEVPLGAFLSGGVDSSTVVAMMARAMDQPVKTFSIGFSEASHDELKYARLTAERYQTDHHEFVVMPDDFFHQTTNIRRDDEFVMIRFVSLRRQPRVFQFVVTRFAKPDGKRLNRLIHRASHHCHDCAGIHSAGQKCAQWNFADQTNAHGLGNQFAQPFSVKTFFARRLFDFVVVEIPVPTSRHLTVLESHRVTGWQFVNATERRQRIRHIPESQIIRNRLNINATFDAGKLQQRLNF